MKRHVTIASSLLVGAAASILTQAAPVSHADACPNVEVIFARGTGDDPGVGWMGQAFVDSVRSRMAEKSVSVYGVDYPASQEFSTAVLGISDAKSHILSTETSCPNTKIVLGGFSQGAAVSGFVTSDTIPAGVDPADVPQPLPVEASRNIAAVVLFGKPNSRFMGFIGQPDVVIGAPYVGKTLELCAEEDPVCSEGMNFSAHNSYGDNGMVARGAEYAVARVNGTASDWS